MEQANQRSTPVSIFTRAGWITGSLHIAPEPELARYIGGDDRYFRLTAVQLPAEEAEREFFAMHADEALLVVPLEVREQYIPAPEGTTPRNIACLLGEGTLFGTLDVPADARVSDYLMGRRGFIPVRRCRTPLMELPADLAEPLELIYLNTRKVIGVAESNPVEMEVRPQAALFSEI